MPNSVHINNKANRPVHLAHALHGLDCLGDINVGTCLLSSSYEYGTVKANPGGAIVRQGPTQAALATE